MILQLNIPASVWVEDTEETSEELLKKLDGISHDEIFSDYFIDDLNPIVRNLDVGEGKLRFQCDENKKILWARVEYTSAQRLNDKQAEALIEYTLGQLSDGIGNNFIQEYEDKTGVFVDLHTDRNKIKIKYLTYA